MSTLKSAVLSPTIAAKKSGVVFLPLGLIKSNKPRKHKTVSIPNQMFFTTCSESSIMVKFGDITFGIRKNDSKYESHINGTVTNGDGEYIGLINAIIRKKVLAGGEYETIVTELNTVAGFSSSIRIFHSRICEPVVKAPKAARETIKKSLVFVPEKHITTFKKACEIMHSQTTLNYILFDKAIYYFPKRKGVVEAQKTSYKIKDMVD